MGPAVTWTTITMDCSDAEALAAFYVGLLGWEITARDGAGWVQARDPEGGVGLNFQAEPGYEPPIWPAEPGRQTKMLHLECLVDDLEAAVAAARSLGGCEASFQPPDRDQRRLRVMLDPAGHPLCLFVAGE